MMMMVIIHNLLETKTGLNILRIMKAIKGKTNQLFTIEVEILEKGTNPKLENIADQGVGLFQNLVEIIAVTVGIVVGQEGVTPVERNVIVIKVVRVRNTTNPKKEDHLSSRLQGRNILILEITEKTISLMTGRVDD